MIPKTGNPERIVLAGSTSADVQPFVSYGTKGCHRVENKRLTKTVFCAMMDLLAAGNFAFPRSSRLTFPHDDQIKKAARTE
jgi:hypothetical protein